MNVNTICYAINLLVNLLATKNIPVSHYGQFLWHYPEVIAPISPLALVDSLL
jgi:hypothetical protein